MSEELKRIGEVALNTTIINPFNRDNIISLHVNVTQVVKRLGKIEWVCYGVVKFKKGNTTGEQRFEGSSFDEVVLLIKNFINNEL
jgi:hypothetical protein